MTVTIVYITTFGHPNEEGGQSVEGMMAFPIFLFWFIYFPGAEGTTGQTLGKRIIGMRVVMQDGGPVTFGSSFVRHLFDLIDVSFAIGILVIKNSEKKQRIGDLIAKTVVLDDAVLCENCKNELELSADEKRMGQFTCPNCRHENRLKTATKTHAKRHWPI
jgi:uncharacterized RDD family membrane protein YckC